jgi:putative phage-type endonuclease
MKSQASDQAVRQTGIGGSDCAVVFGLNPYKTRYQLYLEKVGEVAAPDLSDNEAVYWGTIHEDNVARRYAEKLGVKIRRNNRTLRHPDHPFLMAHLDREVVGTDTILECKTAGEYMSSQWGDEYTAQVPEHYLLQCLHYLVVTGKAECHLAVLIGGNKHRVYVIKAADFPKECALIPIVVGKFWSRCQNLDAPGLETIEDLALKYPTDTTPSVQASPDVVEAVRDLESLREKLKALEQTEKDLKFAVCAAIGDAAELLQGNLRLATFKGQSTSRLDGAALRAAEPAIAEKYTKTTTARVLRLTAAKKSGATRE